MSNIFSYAKYLYNQPHLAVVTHDVVCAVF